MRFIRYREGGAARYGALEGDEVRPLPGAPWEGGAPSGAARPLASLELLPPVPAAKIVCIGRNYVAHARELGHDVPTEPLIFLKPSTSLLPPGGTVLIPPESSRVDYEGELALVIGRRARRVARGSWRDVVLGLTAGLDVTARDLQKKDGQWSRAKGFDTFCPLGPCVDTELDPADLLVETRVNGEVRQSARTTLMIFDVGTLVAHISAAMTLEPGDVILTGTPEGVGPLAPGDAVELAIEGLLPLRVSVAREG